MNTQWIKQVEKSLSEDDIRKKMNGLTKIIPYTDIYKFKTIDELLSPYDHVFLLYLTKPYYGHWTLVFKYPDRNEIHFFDSYGYKPDTEFRFAKDIKFRIKSKQIYHYLVSLLLKSFNKYHISFNQFQMQSHSRPDYKIATCGRWCISRIKNKCLNEYEFYNLFGGNNSNIDKDLLVTKCVNI